MNLNQPIEVEKLVAAVIEQAERASSSIRADALRVAADLKAAADTAEAIRKDATSIWNDATVLVVEAVQVSTWNSAQHEPPTLYEVELKMNNGGRLHASAGRSLNVEIPPGRYRMVVALLPIKEG